MFQGKNCIHISFRAEVVNKCNKIPLFPQHMLMGITLQTVNTAQLQISIYSWLWSCVLIVWLQSLTNWLDNSLNSLCDTYKSTSCMMAFTFRSNKGKQLARKTKTIWHCTLIQFLYIFIYKTWVDQKMLFTKCQWLCDDWDILWHVRWDRDEIVCVNLLSQSQSVGIGHPKISPDQRV